MIRKQQSSISAPIIPKLQVPNQSTLKPPQPNISPNQSSMQFVTFLPEPRFDPKDYISAETSSKDILLFKEIFDFLDCNNNGALQPMDLRRAFTQLGKYNIKKNLVYQIMSDFDQDQSGIIEFREFVKMMTMKPCEEDTVEDIERVYYQIDQDYKGHITLEDLQELQEECKESLKPEDLKTIINACDPDGEGVIRKQAFIKYMKKNNF